MFLPAYVVLGLIVGSFLNVLILRYGIKPVTGRSACPSCGTLIRWYDLIPVLSWLLLRGRCRACKARISVQYPLVELGTALLFSLIAAAPISMQLKILALPIAALLFAIAVHDLYTTIIPDAWVYIVGLLSFGTAIVGVQSGVSWLALLGGPIVSAPLFAMWYVSGGRWMGLGDVKLALSLGWLLGIFGGIYALFLAFILGASVSLPLLALSSPQTKDFFQKFIPIPAFQNQHFGFTMKSEIPFGPFLVASCFIVWFAQMYMVTLPFAW